MTIPHREPRIFPTIFGKADTIQEAFVSEDEEEPSLAVDVAYDFIDEADDDWTKDELLAVLARAGFLLDHEAELDDILEAVLECLEYEKILSEAIKMFLRQNGLRDLREAAERMDCTVEEVLYIIIAKVNLWI